MPLLADAAALHANGVEPAAAYANGVQVLDVDDTIYTTPTFVQASTISGQSNAPTRAITTTAGNLVVAIARKGGDANTANRGALTGGTEAAFIAGSNNVLTVASKVAAGGSETFTWTFGGTDQGRLLVMEFANATQTLAGAASNSTGSNVTSLAFAAEDFYKAAAFVACTSHSVAVSAAVWTSALSITTRNDGTNGLIAGSAVAAEGDYAASVSWTTSATAAGMLVAFRGTPP